MSVPCPIPWEVLVDYWAGELAQTDEDAIDEHSFACSSCSESSARIAAITETIRAQIPPLITEARLAELSSRGLSIRENPMQPGERRDVVFPADTDLLIHRLGGLNLAAAVRVDFSMFVESSGRELAGVANLAFDRTADTVLLACQKHYASLPPDTVAEIHVHDQAGVRHVFRYTILHHFE